MRAFARESSLNGPPPVQGNPCLICLAERAPANPPPPSSITQCITWPVAAHRAAVRCWTASGKEIQLCGHGLLCCARYWRNEWGRNAALEMNGLHVHCEWMDSLDWVSFPRINISEIPVPNWATDLLGEAPIAAAFAGPDDGYLVLTMPPDFDLASVTPPNKELASSTARSLILTRRVSEKGSSQGENIQLRYFAPQYGVPEDTATGSAMRVLADYWNQHEGLDTLQALQCSPGGGWLASRIAQDRTWVGGGVVQDKEGRWTIH